MKGILLLNGEPYTGEIDAENAVTYCCDGAYAWAKGKVRIDKTIGDFDSLPYVPDPAPEEIYPSEKDFTDGEIALFKMINAGITDIEIYGGGGRREDHFFGNLHLLYHAHLRGAKARLITETSFITATSGTFHFKNLKGKTISVLPFGGKVHIMDSKGLKYSYPDSLSYGECRGISNIVNEEDAYIKIADGDVALIIINRRAV